MNREIQLNKDESLDSFYLGRILVIQKKRGYRFSVDAPLLADFIRAEEPDELIELGTGNGIISLLLSIKPFKHITAVEIQGSLADLAKRNVRLNSLESRITIIQQDLRFFKAEKKYDVVFSNPPYIRRSEGHLSPSREKSIAKHELKCEIFDIMRKTGELLKKQGRSYFIFPSSRKEDFLDALADKGLVLKKVRDVCARPGEPPNLFLSECGFAVGKTEIQPPLVLYDEEGEYTQEAREIFAGRPHA